MAKKSFSFEILIKNMPIYGIIVSVIFLYNWTRITELRSIHKRLMEFEIAINYDTKKLRKPHKSDVRA